MSERMFYIYHAAISIVTDDNTLEELSRQIIEDARLTQSETDKLMAFSETQHLRIRGWA